MERRGYLLTLGLTALAGCTSQDNEDQSTQPISTSTPTESPTPTATPEPPSPEIDEATLVTRWDEFGDVLSNQADSVGAGGYANVGIRYSLPVHDGQSEEFVQVTIYHDGSSVTTETATRTDLSDDNVEENDWERWFGFDTDSWEQGTYTAEIIVRDEISGKNSSSVTFDFEVVEPLAPGEVEIVEISKPPEITVGDSITYDITFENTSGRDSSIVSTLSARYEDSQWVEASDEDFHLNLPSGGSYTWTSGEVSFDQTGTYQYRYDDIEAVITISVTE